jgi:methionyl-tRNA formyltransferase
MIRKPRILYAANREIGLRCLRELVAAGLMPIGLAVAAGGKADYADRMCGLVPKIPVLMGSSFRSPEGIQVLARLKPDYWISVHFPYLVPPEVLAIPHIGSLNLHPAFLPYNRGWHTPTWAIMEGTPYGATLHWMDEGLDSGPIVLQKDIEVLPEDTAHSLYKRVLALEVELFRDALPLIRNGELPKKPQSAGSTTHQRADLASVQSLDDWVPSSAREVLDRLRALTTNRIEEAAFFTERGKRYRVQVTILAEQAADGE